MDTVWNRKVISQRYKTLTQKKIFDWFQKDTMDRIGQLKIRNWLELDDDKKDLDSCTHHFYTTFDDKSITNEAKGNLDGISWIRIVSLSHSL